MKKSKIIFIYAVVLLLLYFVFISLRNNLTLVIRSDFPVYNVDVEFYINDSLINKNKNFSIRNQFDFKNVNSFLWINNYSYRIVSKSKRIDYNGEVFLYKDKIVELYFLNDSLSNEHIVREVNR
jgi:hypothetical protein